MASVTTLHSDPTLPGLHIALDAGLLIEALSARLPECSSGVRLLDARVHDVQYAPGSTAHVLWKLRVHDPATRRTGRQLVCVRALRRDEPPAAQPVELIRRYAERRARPGVGTGTPLRTAWLYLPDLHLVMHAYPLDPQLPTLIDVTDPRVMRDLLHRAWQPRRMRVRSVTAETLSYTPEARAALRINVLAEEKDSRLPELRRLVGKLHVNRAPDRLFAGHWAVWRGAGGRGVAPPAGYVSQAQLSLQEFVDGTRLSDLAGTGSFLGIVRRSAQAIARVHELTLPVLSTRRVEKEIAVVERWIGILSRLRPQHAARLTGIGRRLRHELAARMCIRGTIHADFHLANVLSEGTGVSIIDWDQAAHGDPMVDVGRVLASLRVSSLRVHGRIDGFADVEAAFLEAYVQRTGENEQRARLFEAVSLLIAAAGPFRLQREGWEEDAELMLDEVERTLALSLHGAPIAGSAPDVKRQVAFDHRPEWALDRTYVQSLLVPVVHQMYGSDIEVTECAPSRIRSTPADMHVRWTLKGYRGARRWRGPVEGIGFVDHSGRGPLRRLQFAADKLNHSHPGTLQLPRPLGHLEPLAMLVFERPSGEPLTRMLGTAAERDALERCARSLARFHALDIDLAKHYETDRTVRSVVRRVDRLGQACHPAALPAARLLERLRSQISMVGERRAPVAQGLGPGWIRMTPSGASAAVVVDVVNAEPLLAVGELIAQLHLRAAQGGASASAASHMARAYAAASGDSPASIAAFAALALLRRGCRAWRQDRTGPNAGLMIAAAADMIEVQV